MWNRLYLGEQPFWDMAQIGTATAFGIPPKGALNQHALPGVFRLLFQEPGRFDESLTDHKKVVTKSCTLLHANFV